VTECFTDLGDPSWLALFESVEESWFRLETLQVYEVDYERAEIEDFLRHGALHREPSEWQRMLSRHTKAGRTLQRVHVVEEPLTDYLRYELAAYRQNAEAGEDIRLLPVPRPSWPDDLPRGGDFWLFDDREVWDMHYDAEGHFLRATRSASTSHLDECRAWRDVAIKRSVSLADYLSNAA
jgi:hypothetical protein